MKIAIWGNELTAWATAGALAETGNDIYFVSNSQIKDPVTLMGSSIRNEPGLRDLICDEFEHKRIRFAQTRTALGLQVHIISMNPNEFDSAREIVEKLAGKAEGPLLIINQSHFGVGSTEQLQALLNIRKKQHVVYLAENISEGEALERIRNPKSMILGSNDYQATLEIESLFKAFSSQLENLYVMTPTEAEFTKLSIIGMLALRIGYINELANLGEQLGVDIDVIRRAMGADPRIGRHHLAPGCGFGGNTFPQTLDSLAQLLSEKNESTLMHTVLQENEKQKELPFRKLWQHYKADLHDRKIAIWGASFKPGSASLDAAPSLKVIDAIVAQQAEVRIHDPEALENVHHHYHDNPYVKIINGKYDALKNVDALLLLTEWPEYWSPDFEVMLKQMKTPVIIDGRNVYNREKIESLGFTYYAIGK
ncbi:MAG: UDP-glucose/GDP-mannose dehydrogenase family protein [Gammaproteobacteria bacterium]|nr:UDP-glucose/GDP-mannose dehydrogenase family protein [Gammaproteobacteria bacterium]